MDLPPIPSLPPLSEAEQRRRHHLGPSLAGEGLTVHRLGLAYTMPPGLVEWRAPVGDWLFMLLHDPMSVGTGAGLAEAEPPGLAVWDPGQAPHYGHPERPWRHSWLHASGPLAEAAGRRLRRRPVHRLDDAASAVARLRVLSDQVLTDPDPVLAGHAAASFLYVLVRQCAPERAPPPAWLSVARAVLDERFREPLVLTAVARQAGRTPTHLCAAFRAWLGVSPKQYLVARRLDEAAFRLRCSGATVAQIAGACGFNDLPHFTRLFRRRFGRPPGAYRQG